MKNKNARGFTLIELLIVIAIVGIISSVITVSLMSARDQAKSAKASSELTSIHRGIIIMNNDTERYPNNLDHLCEDLATISSTNEFLISDPNSGLVTNGRGWDGWNGPYVSRVPIDPWGTEYYFDDDYACTPDTIGCGDIDDGGNLLTSVIVSCGPNKAVSGGACTYDNDNIVKVLCQR